MTLPQGPPSHEELEVTLIGPNVGECILLHYKGSWIIIDSCIDRVSGFPAALQYLDSLGIQQNQVKIIACSHWHDDHFKGLGQIYQAYPNAQFWMSSALKAGEFLSLIEAYRGWPASNGPHTSGVKELTACIDLARKSGIPPKFATHDQRMWLCSDGLAELWSLSPSSQMIAHAFQDISNLVATPWSTKVSATITGPNNIAVAMYFTAGAHSVLLGSDLEEQGNPLTGWSAVLASTSRPRQLASLYKVAHHGSATAEHSGIWSSLLTSNPLSILTPFTRSKLPRDIDVVRIKANSSKAFISSSKVMPAIKRLGALGKMTKGKKMKVVDGLSGLIQCRVIASDPAAEWNVYLHGSASQL